jgi:hypothetical protein
MSRSTVCRVALSLCAVMLAAIAGCSRDATLTDDAARQSPQAKLAIDFLGALRTMDVDTISKLATADQVARIRQEIEQPTEEFQQFRALMSEELPADAAALLGKITSVQTHRDRAVVYLESGSNTWFVQFTRTSSGWKVSGF